jgi:sec-independent protein translocase protein TatA
MMNPVLSLFALFDPGGTEILLIMFIVLLLFGGDKLPQFAKGLGKAIREFKKAASNVEDEIKRAIDEVPEPVKPLPKLPAVQASVPAAPPPVAPVVTTPEVPAIMPPPAPSAEETNSHG